MKYFFVLILSAITAQVFSQDYTEAFTISRNQKTMTGMYVLGGWGLANAMVGTSGWIASKNVEHRNFYQMTTLWGAVNIGAAVLGYTHAKKSLQQQQSMVENLKAQTRIEKTFVINGALDIAYMGTGIFLNNRGNTNNNLKLKGYGSSILMQGIFLFLFDGTMYTIHRINGNKYRHHQ